MRLFLTSSPCDHEAAIASGLPFVYSEANGFANLLRDMLPVGGRGVMLAAYPDSWEQNDAMARDFAAAFEPLGRPLSSMEMLDSRTDPAYLAQALADCDVAILSGGHVPTQNRFFHQWRVADAIRRCHGVVIGISAGSMNCCDQVYAQPEEPGEAVDPGYQRFITGLGLTDVMILPHYQQVKDNLVDGLRLFEDISIPDSRGQLFYVLPDGSFVLQEGPHRTLFGEAWRLRDGQMEKIAEYGEHVAV